MQKEAAFFSRIEHSKTADIHPSFIFGGFPADGGSGFQGGSAGCGAEYTILDRDDGRLVYEGEAELDGRFYDFEMTAEGKIIEWERD